MTRQKFLLILATVVLTAASVVFCTTASAHPFQQQRDTTRPGSRPDTITHRTDTQGLPDYYRSLMMRAADSIRRQRDTVRQSAANSGLIIDSAGRLVRDSARRRRDTARPGDSLRFPLYDRRGDRFSNPYRNPFDLKDPPNLRDSIVYDPATQQYYILEKIGNQWYRKPTYLTFDEMMKLSADSAEDDYFRKRADALDALNRRMLRPKLSVSDNLFNRIFGNGKIDIKPQGNVDITAGYQGQNIQNPALPESARKTGGFDFNESANLQVVGNIGDKLKLPISYNTLANFDFENQLKLDYTGGPDEIIKKVEAGNVSFTTPSTLMTGAQSLFGIKTKMQFGKLSVTAVLANQRSQKQSVSSQGGAAVTSFQFKADDYDENRNFLLAQYFRSNYNKAMSTLPVISSQVQILRMEVWVTNRNGIDTGSRQIVGLMDLGEASPYSTHIGRGSANLPNGLPDNDVNTEYRSIINDPSSRSPTTAATKLNSLGLQQVQDFEIVFARKLNTTDYTFNPQVGFLSINQSLQANDVLAVAYQYSYNGHIYQVGEFSTDVPPDTTTTGNGSSKVLYLKLLKATSQRTNLPLWGLMMKNIYTLKTATGSFLANIQQTGFQFNINYDQPSLGTKRYLPEGPKQNIPLLSVLGLDRLNQHNDPGSDGIFDYIEGLTVISSQGKIIFPVLEPFGRDLDTLAFAGAPASLKDKYVFYQLYDTIKAVAQTFANVDRYVLNGSAKGQSTSSLSLNAYNVPPGSVVVTAGGQTLKEGQDYIVDYNLGQVQIINQSIIQSGVPVNVSFENNANFGLQQRSFMGVRLDYLAKSTPTESLNFGATFERLNERPFFSKTDYGQDPIRNSMYGTDVNYRGQLPQLTRLLDKLPFYTTKEMSTINAYGEAAILRPGHPPQIGSGSAGAVYIDDFEGSTSAIDLRFPLTSWALASTPNGTQGTQPVLFPEAALNDSLDYGYNRAQIAWYNIDPTLQDPSNANNPVSYEKSLDDPRIAPIQVQQLFPTQTVATGQAQLVTFDVAYYPTDRGPYNFDARPGSIASSGKLNNPTKRWGGIMRALDQTDFETANIEVLQFWVLSPFAKTVNGVGNTTGGQLYIDLGSVSEDILKDGKKEFENGLNTPNINAEIDATSVWGRVPANPIQVTTAFSNDAADRPYQDVGFDGMRDVDEQTKFARFITALQPLAGGSAAYTYLQNDPANDNFMNYRDASYDAQKAGILSRYKKINNPQGNSPIATTGSTTITAYTLYPDQEDLNKDNTMNTLEQYFEYKVNLTPDSLGRGGGFSYITDTVTFIPSGTTASQTWYQVTIPLSEYYQNVGNMPDFRSIQFIRMYMTGWSDSAVLRFAQLQLVRNSWRSFSYVIDTTGNMTLLPTSNTSFNVTAVNIEQNSQRTPINYVSPPGVVRQQELSNNNVNLLLNEQAMSLQICNLVQGDVRGVYKTTNLDLRRYGTMDMFVHAEAVVQNQLQDYDMSYVVRLGSDFVANYYEIRVPIVVTKGTGALSADTVWPSGNNLALSLSRLIQLKVDRNNHVSPSNYYKETDASTGRTYAILGNPNLGAIQAFFLGVQNVNRSSVCTEVWFNELRLTNISEKGGWAAVGKVDMKLADLGTLTVSGSNKSSGWGTIDQSTNQRSLEDDAEVDAAINIDAGKLLPRKAAVSIPVYAGFTRTTSTPEYDPFDLDIKLKDKINAAPASEKDSIRKQAIDQTTVETLNFTNVHKNNNTGKKLKIWSIENINISYSYTRSEHHSPLATEDELITHKAILSYNYTHTAKFIQPFRKIKSKSPWLGLIRDFNFNLMPTVLGFQANINRTFGAYRSRNIGGPDILPESFNKFFTFDRLYTLRWDLTKNLVLDFTAANKAWIDEDSGRLNKEQRRLMWHRFWRGGRTILYNQTLNVTYNLPINKIPALDWTSVKAGYSATYTWTGASQLLAATQLGNTLNNTQQRNVIAEFDFIRLYSKWKLLKGLDQPPPRMITVNGKQVPDTAHRKPTVPTGPEINPVAKGLLRLVTSLKHVSFNYSDNSSSTIYGFMDSTQAFGLDFRSMQPGWGYVFGKRADTNFINKLGQKNLLSRDTALNNQNVISFTQHIVASAILEPVRDLRISINLDKTFGQTYSELYKDTVGGNGFARLNPYIAGSFNISFISYKTLFEKYRPDQISATFARFENYRAIISSRLGNINPYTGGLIGADGYAVGYGRYAQDVLIPAFVAAYTGKSPTKVALINESGGNVTTNPFSGYLPKPNWHISYNGLSRLPWFSKVFTSFNLTNGYTSSLSMNSFNSNLNYNDPSRYGQPGFIDTLTGNFVPYYMVPNITIQEAFSPLLGLDMQFVNLMSASASYSRSRNLSLSLIDFQLSETHSSEISVKLGYRKKNVGLPFGWKVPGNGKTPPNGPPGSVNASKGSNDLILGLTVSIRDDAMSSSYLDQNASLPTGGQKVVRIEPNVNYVLNNRINLNFYFSETRTTPKISTTPPIVTTKGGVTIRISLAP